MENLNKRQIIILAVMVLAILYGLYVLLSGPAKPKQALVSSQQQSKQLSDYINTFNANMAAEVPRQADAYMIGRINKEWSRNPFMDRGGFRAWMASKEPAKGGVGRLTFNYTGYIEAAGGKRVAIVNGFEYAAGDIMDTPGYRVKSIFPRRVIIENMNDQSLVTVPLQE